MLKVLTYKEKWIYKRDRAVRIQVPVYEDIGKGGGLERSFRMTRDGYGNPLKPKPTSVKDGEI